MVAHTFYLREYVEVVDAAVVVGAVLLYVTNLLLTQYGAMLGIGDSLFFDFV